MRDLPCERIQVDEAWAFIYVKEKNVATAKAAPRGAPTRATWSARGGERRRHSRDTSETI